MKERISLNLYSIDKYYGFDSAVYRLPDGDFLLFSKDDKSVPAKILRRYRKITLVDLAINYSVYLQYEETEKYLKQWNTLFAPVITEYATIETICGFPYTISISFEFLCNMEIGKIYVEVVDSQNYLQHSDVFFAEKNDLMTNVDVFGMPELYLCGTHDAIKAKIDEIVSIYATYRRNCIRNERNFNSKAIKFLVVEKCYQQGYSSQNRKVIYDSSYSTTTFAEFVKQCQNTLGYNSRYIKGYLRGNSIAFDMAHSGLPYSLIPKKIILMDIAKEIKEVASKKCSCKVFASFRPQIGTVVDTYETVPDSRIHDNFEYYKEYSFIGNV